MFNIGLHTWTDFFKTWLDDRQHLRYGERPYVTLQFDACLNGDIPLCKVTVIVWIFLLVLLFPWNSCTLCFWIAFLNLLLIMAHGVLKDSIFMVTSPTKRRESTPLLEKIKTDVSMTKLKLSSTWKKEEKAREVKDDSPILKYLTSQVRKVVFLVLFGCLFWAPCFSYW